MMARERKPHCSHAVLIGRQDEASCDAPAALRHIVNIESKPLSFRWYNLHLIAAELLVKEIRSFFLDKIKFLGGTVVVIGERRVTVTFEIVRTYTDLDKALHEGLHHMYAVVHATQQHRLVG